MVKMENNKEDILDALNDFGRKPSDVHNDRVPPLLEEYLGQVARTGETWFPWVKVKPLFLHKMDQVIWEFFKKPIDNIGTVTGMELNKFKEMRSYLMASINKFSGAPFTIQRLCELITEPNRHYQRIDKFLRGIEKNVQVVSTVDPFGNKVVHESRVIQNGTDTDGYTSDKQSPDTTQLSPTPFLSPPGAIMSPFPLHLRNAGPAAPPSSPVVTSTDVTVNAADPLPVTNQPEATEVTTQPTTSQPQQSEGVDSSSSVEPPSSHEALLAKEEAESTTPTDSDAKSSEPMETDQETTVGQGDTAEKDDSPEVDKPKEESPEVDKPPEENPETDSSEPEEKRLKLDKPEVADSSTAEVSEASEVVQATEPTESGESTPDNSDAKERSERQGSGDSLGFDSVFNNSDNKSSDLSNTTASKKTDNSHDSETKSETNNETSEVDSGGGGDAQEESQEGAKPSQPEEPSPKEHTSSVDQDQTVLPSDVSQTDKPAEEPSVESSSEQTTETKQEKEATVSEEEEPMDSESSFTI